MSALNFSPDLCAKHEEQVNQQTDTIRELRDIAANFVRMIDATAFDHENKSTAELYVRLDTLKELHDFAHHDPELAKLPTDDLIERAKLLARIKKGMESQYIFGEVSNKTLEKRARLLERVIHAQQLVDDITEDELLALGEQVRKQLSKRKRLLTITSKNVFPIGETTDIGEVA